MWACDGESGMHCDWGLEMIFSLIAKTSNRMEGNRKILASGY